MSKVGIVCYNSSNIFNLINSLKNIGCIPKLILNKKDLSNVDRLILPGVGNVKYAMNYLNSKKIHKEIIEMINGGTPTLGICLGMQLLFDFSYENQEKCLGIFKGEVKKLDRIFFKIPNINWCKIYSSDFKNNIFFKKDSFYYFIHSYICSSTFKFQQSYYLDKNFNYLAGFIHNNIIATQFHPELSGISGDNILRKFINF